MLPIVDIALRHQGVHVLFNNNHANYATTNALEMTEMLLGEGLNVIPSGGASRCHSERRREAP